MKFRRNITTGIRTTDREPILPVRTNVKAGFITVNHNEALAT